MWPFSSYPEVSINSLNDQYDFIVVGGGTAGCVLANRLSADPSKTVLLLERGPRVDSWASRVPLFSSDFSAERAPTIKRSLVKQNSISTSLDLYSGSLLGGSSKVNAMIYARGLPAEYDKWSEAGRRGWSWEEVQPYFFRSERSSISATGGSHNVNGEWKTRIMGNHLYFTCYDRIVSAAEELNLPYIDDLNSPANPPFGCGHLHFTIDESGRRHSTYDAFLPRALAASRKNLHVCTNALVEKVDIERMQDGLCVARGITFIVNAGTGSERRRFVRAEREIVLSAGPFGSPHILMLSGIGPSQHLAAHKVPVLKDLPAVGSNLEDHFGVSVGFTVPKRESIGGLQKYPWLFIIELIRYLFWGIGLLLDPVVQVAIFVHTGFLDAAGRPYKAEKVSSKESKDLPDIEILPIAYNACLTRHPTEEVFSFLNLLLHPRSKGTVRLSSTDPREPLVIDPRYLANPADFAPLRASLKLSMRLIERIRASGYPTTDFVRPVGESDADLDDFIRKNNCTTYHYSSTCRMAPEDDPQGGGVVDDELRVHGVGQLRIADTSVFPWVVGTHLQAPAVMIAEKCADMMLNGERK